MSVKNQSFFYDWSHTISKIYKVLQIAIPQEMLSSTPQGSAVLAKVSFNSSHLRRRHILRLNNVLSLLVINERLSIPVPRCKNKLLPSSVGKLTLQIKASVDQFESFVVDNGQNFSSSREYFRIITGGQASGRH
jgi:hypothetical protein